MDELYFDAWNSNEPTLGDWKVIPWGPNGPGTEREAIISDELSAKLDKRNIYECDARKVRGGFEVVAVGEVVSSQE